MRWITAFDISRYTTRFVPDISRARLRLRTLPLIAAECRLWRHYDIAAPGLAATRASNARHTRNDQFLASKGYRFSFTLPEALIAD